MDNYIVRIYRRERDNPRLLVGLVEEVGSAGKKAFNTLDDLWEILNAKKKHPKRSTGGGAGRCRTARRIKGVQEEPTGGDDKG